MFLFGFNDDKEDFGKKGEVLRILNKILIDYDDVFVPDTLVLPLSFFNNFIKPRLLSNKQELLSQIECIIILNEIKRKFNDKKIVVRSSASCEDSILFTNSGQYDSFLNLKSNDEILQAINKIFLSFMSSNAMEYYKINNIDFRNQGMAVLVQEVAPVKRAGVMFTANPITGDNNPIIEFCDGLGEDVVSGQKKTTTIKDNYTNISDMFKKLLVIGKKIESVMGMPQDIEWGFDDDNNIYIFQARPIIINKRKVSNFKNINIPNDYIVGNSISKGFAIGKITELEKCDNSEIILQTGKLTSKDLFTIINNKAILLKTGGYLSHFANIIREFNKPSIIIEENQNIDLSKNYVIDGYNGYIYKLESLSLVERNKAYWNYFVDLIYNGNSTYLNKIGICGYKITINNSIMSNIDGYLILDNKLFMNMDNQLLEIEFRTVSLLNDFIYGISERGNLNGKVYRRK